MRVAIMQPYFFPYIGYFQLINSVDRFIIYDEIQYTKKGWINRNRYLNNGNPDYFTLPLKKDSDYLNINQRYLSEDWSLHKRKLLNKLKEAYRKAPYFKERWEWLEEIIEADFENLFEYNYNSIKKVCAYLDVKTELTCSSNIKFNNDLKGEEKVIDICRTVNAETYINPIGGVELYSKESFSKYDINLLFLASNLTAYKQFNKPFVPYLSIIDVLMFNDLGDVQKSLTDDFKII